MEPRKEWSAAELQSVEGTIPLEQFVNYLEANFDQLAAEGMNALVEPGAANREALRKAVHRVIDRAEEVKGRDGATRREKAEAELLLRRAWVLDGRFAVLFG